MFSDINSNVGVLHQNHPAIFSSFITTFKSRCQKPPSYEEFNYLIAIANDLMTNKSNLTAELKMRNGEITNNTLNNEILRQDDISLDLTKFFCNVAK